MHKLLFLVITLMSSSLFASERSLECSLMEDAGGPVVESSVPWNLSTFVQLNSEKFLAQISVDEQNVNVVVYTVSPRKKILDSELSLAVGESLILTTYASDGKNGVRIRCSPRFF